MIVSRFALAAVFGVLSGFAHAQTATAPPIAAPQPGGAGLRSGNIAATGQTVPNPQTLPTAPRTTVDRPLGGKETGRVDYGICKGC